MPVNIITVCAQIKHSNTNARFEKPAKFHVGRLVQLARNHHAYTAFNTNTCKMRRRIVFLWALKCFIYVVCECMELECAYMLVLNTLSCLPGVNMYVWCVVFTLLLSLVRLYCQSASCNRADQLVSLKISCRSVRFFKSVPNIFFYIFSGSALK